MDNKILQIITQDVMEQYEQVRQSGATNMFDQTGVAVIAEAMGFTALLNIALDRDKYMLLLSNFGELMKHYGVIQN